MSSEPGPTGSVEFRDYLTVFKRQLGLIVAVTLLGAAAAAAYSFRRTPVYESTASVLVRAITTNAFDPSQRVDQQLNMFNQRQLVTSEPVAAVAAKELGTTATPDQLIKHVTADVPANSQIIRIHYRDTVPLSAQRGADAFAKAYLSFREADARTQATTSQKALQRDIDRLVKQPLAVSPLRQAREAEPDSGAVLIALGQALVRSGKGEEGVRLAAAGPPAVVEDPNSTPEQARGATGRVASLNARIQPLQAQLTGFASLDFNPGTVISAAALPKQPASPKHRLDVGRQRRPG